MVDQDTLSSRLSALDSYLTELDAFRAHTRQRFVAEPALHHLAERLLHLSCECVLDTAHHVISDAGYRQPGTYRDAMDVLQEERLIEPELAEKLKDWMGFRNILVHFYLKVDHGRSYDAIVEDLASLRAFADRMSRLL